MLLHFSLFVLLVVSPFAFAADAVEGGSDSCLIKSGDGPFGYDPRSGKGPADWPTLLPTYSTCGTGQIQSPIDFPDKVRYAPKSRGPKPSLKRSNFTFSPTSSNWALTCAEENTCGFTMYNGTKLNHFNIHLHAPSEHTLNGRSYPLEAHFVHASDDGTQFGVIATMFDYPDEEAYINKIEAGRRGDVGHNKFMDEVLKGVSTGGTFGVPSARILRPGMGYCKYTGSLTTPPCTEGVTFFMAAHIETVSRRQVWDYIISAGASFDGNNRPIQPRNGREITCYV